MPVRLLIFVNAGSGSKLAPALIAQFSSDPTIAFVRLPEEAASWSEIHRESLQEPGLRVISCGGDGSVNWVLSLLSAVYGFDERPDRPPLAILPYGGGNDMARSLGWGHTLDTPAAEYFHQVCDSTLIRQADVWKIEIYRTDTHDITSTIMANYFSLGPDAETAYDTEKCRQGRCKPCFCCGCMAQFCTIPAALGNLCGKRPLSVYTDIIVTGANDQNPEARHRLKPESRDKTLIIQTIPSMYAGRDPWNRDVTRGMDDGRFEVTLQGGMWSVGFFLIGMDTGRPQCQASKMEITASEPCFIEIDGEGIYINGPSRITIKRGGSYPLIFRRR
jgi:diacylglycerol kinase (ATP)